MNSSAVRTAARIELRAWNESDFVLAWGWIQQYPAAILHDYGPHSAKQFIDDHLVRGSINWGVYRDGILGGLLVADLISPHLLEAHCYFKRGRSAVASFWGWETTRPALELGIAWAWEHGYGKITAPVFAGNALMRHLLKRLGAVEEAYFRGHTKQNGKLIDVLYYSLFRGEG